MGTLSRGKRSAREVFRDPDDPFGVDIDANADAVIGRIQQIKAMPIVGRLLIEHVLFNGLYSSPVCGIRSCIADIFAAARPENALVRHARAGVRLAGTLMAHAATGIG